MDLLLAGVLALLAIAAATAVAVALGVAAPLLLVLVGLGVAHGEGRRPRRASDGRAHASGLAGLEDLDAEQISVELKGAESA